MKRATWLALALPLVIAAACAEGSAAQQPDARVPQALIHHTPSVAVTHHAGTFGGVPVKYTAIVEEHILRGPDSIPNASLVTIAYVREGIPDATKRPVMFVFNGGPGSSSSPLHMSGIGPRRATDTGTIQNAESILDATDLVFIDPVGTGFSRPYTTEVGRKYYWSRTGDAESVARVIEMWLYKHRRQASPRYLAGESYGTMRAGLVLRARPQLKWNGVLLVSVVSMLDNAGRDMPFVSMIPTFATSARYHGVIDSTMRTVEQVYREAARFARTDYLVALAQGTRLSDAERHRVAQRLAQLTGLPADYIVSRQLRITQDDWMLNVLKARGLRTGMLDTRVVAARDTTRTGGLNDPAFNGGRMRIGTAMVAPAIVPGTPQSEQPRPDTTAPPSPIETYLIRDLGFATLESYRTLNLDINPGWVHDDHSDAMELVAEAARANPAMKVFWIGGYYDLSTPVFGAQYLMDQVGLPPERTTSLILPGAHSVFADDANRRILAARLRTWVR